MLIQIRCMIHVFCQPTKYYFFLIAGSLFLFFEGDSFGFLKHFFQHCFISRPSDSTVSLDARIELRTVATLALAVRCCSNSVF